MNNFTGQLVVVLTAIVGVASLAVLVSKNSQSPQVINAGGNALSNFLGVAISPVTANGMTGTNFGNIASFQV